MPCFDKKKENMKVPGNQELGGKLRGGRVRWLKSSDFDVVCLCPCCHACSSDTAGSKYSKCTEYYYCG